MFYRKVGSKNILLNFWVNHSHCTTQWFITESWFMANFLAKQNSSKFGRVLLHKRLKFDKWFVVLWCIFCRKGNKAVWWRVVPEGFHDLHSPTRYAATIFQWQNSSWEFTVMFEMPCCQSELFFADNPHKRDVLYCSKHKRVHGGRMSNSDSSQLSWQQNVILTPQFLVFVVQNDSNAKRVKALSWQVSGISTNVSLAMVFFQARGTAEQFVSRSASCKQKRSSNKLQPMMWALACICLVSSLGSLGFTWPHFSLTVLSLRVTNAADFWHLGHWHISSAVQQINSTKAKIWFCLLLHTLRCSWWTRTCAQTCRVRNTTASIIGQVSWVSIFLHSQTRYFSSKAPEKRKTRAAHAYSSVCVHVCVCHTEHNSNWGSLKHVEAITAQLHRRPIESLNITMDNAEQQMNERSIVTKQLTYHALAILLCNKWKWMSHRSSLPPVLCFQGVYFDKLSKPDQLCPLESLVQILQSMLSLIFPFSEHLVDTHANVPCNSRGEVNSQLIQDSRFHVQVKPNVIPLVCTTIRKFLEEAFFEVLCFQLENIFWVLQSVCNFNKD